METQAKEGYPKAAYVIAAALAAAIMGGAYFGYRQQAQTRQDVQAGIRTWFEGPKLTAEIMTERYGPPDELTLQTATWHERGSWKRIAVHGDTPYRYLEQTVGYQARPGVVGRLLAFDNGARYDIVNEELTASSNHETSNYLALNLAHDVAAGKRSIDNARGFFASTARLWSSGKSSPYMEHLLFTPYRRAPQENWSRRGPIKL